MLEAQPKGGFLLFGNGDVGEGSCMVHNPGYDFNDASLVPASSYWGALVEAAAINKNNTTTLYGKEYGMTAIVNESVSVKKSLVAGG